MNSPSLFRYYQEIKNSRIILVFKGAVTQDVLGELGSLVRLRFGDGTENATMRRLFAVLIEMAQNILHYSAEREFLPYLGREVGVGVITVRDLEGAYVISSGNLVGRTTADSLAEKLAQISALDREELKQLYLDQRRKEAPSDSKGAGLGLIDIARKSTGALDYHVDPVDAEMRFFTLSASIEKRSAN